MTSVQVEIPEGFDPEEMQQELQSLVRHREQARDFADSVARRADLLHVPVAAQVVSAEHLWRHLIDDYGVYTAADIARLRGADPKNRSVASNLARRANLLGVRRGRAKLYPRFQFKGRAPHPEWGRIVSPLLGASWDPEDILLWMVAPNATLEGREPASLIAEGQADELVGAAELESSEIW